MTAAHPLRAFSIVPPAPVCCCMPWHGRGFEDEKVHGAACCYCDRDVAAPESARGKTVACIYCGLDRGLIPEMEIEPFAERGNEADEELPEVPA